MTSHKALPEGKVISESVGHSVVSDSSTPWPVACQNLLSMRILQASIVSCPAPGDLLNQGIESRSPALQADSLPSEPLGALNKRKFIKSQSKEGGKRGAVRSENGRPCHMSAALLSFVLKDSMLMCNFCVW